MKVSINGCGRIGGLLIRYLVEAGHEIAHLNDVCSLESAAYLLQYDSVHGTWSKTVTAELETSTISINGVSVPFTCNEDPSTVSWPTEIVCDCTGKFLKVKVLTDSYFSPSSSLVQRVVVSAPVKESPALNVVLGCNDNLLTSSHKIITNASCTTNCLAPVIKVIKNNLGIVRCCITTIHNVTGTQTLVDMPNTKKSDLRRARSGMLNLAPTTTGSATAITEIYPELKGKINGSAVRVPLLNGSLTDIVVEVERDTTKEEVNDLMKKASEEGDLVGILGFNMLPLVSTDYTNDERSCIIDGLSTMVIDKRMVKIYAWYDNECGYSKRMAELVEKVGKL
ncbi:hypothetical protein TL16_g07047 [Triparma laevis f. inornata]|uniref:glyceraldehyde-3-phosphate dehydrogenase (NADP(+)) (phosphorylating) n=2 Tax=Triparma laevis TaxID=1534972 RepID=A0A9W7E664_9STRA|nr:hypothetical protein TrLO_g8097 [Triparma laevis f. longispina]GMH76345.1 hypothetical protein TL16_g07047 [Triparma laevis f. inornata]